MKLRSRLVRSCFACSARIQVLAVTVLLALPGESARADEWARRVRACDEALASRDVVLWDHALRGLANHDHPAAVLLLGRFYAEHVRRGGEWRRTQAAAALRVMTEEPLQHYKKLLSGRTNVRSLRAMVEVLDEDDRVEAPLFVEALKASTGFHLVEDRVRASLRRAARRGRVAVGRRYLDLLRGRLHARDIAWVEELVGDRKLDANLRLELLECLPSPAMWRRLLERHASRPLFEGTVLGEAVVRRLGATGPAAEAAALLEMVAADAACLRVALETPEDEEKALAAALQGLPAWRARAALHTVYQERWLALLGEEAMAGLFDLHAAFTKLRYARAYRRDSYLHPKRQRQPWDRRMNESRILSRPASIDVTDPAVGAHARLLAILREQVHALDGGRGWPPIPAPYHADLLEINGGRARRVDDLAFSPGERAWRDRRDRVREFNLGVRGPTPEERESVVLVNDYRLEHDMLPLRIDPDLTEAAREHSRFQRAVGEIAHMFRTRREPAGQTPMRRMIHAGYPARYAGGENVLMGTSDPRLAVRWWQGSSAHRRNMLLPGWTEIGVGRSGRFWTQNFGREPYDQDHHAEAGAKSPAAPGRR